MWAYGIVWYEILCWLLHEEGFAWKYLQVGDEAAWLYYRTETGLGWPLNEKILTTVMPHIQQQFIRKVISLVEQAPLPDEV